MHILIRNTPKQYFKSYHTRVQHILMNLTSNGNSVAEADERIYDYAPPRRDEHLSTQILLVEDYAPNIMVATMMLEDMGFEVISAKSGGAAIKFVSESTSPFAAILMDVQMQGMDGLEATRRIRWLEKSKGFRHTIIGVTAHTLAGDRERCLSAGMDDYISKPIHPDILGARLRSLAPVPRDPIAA